MRVTDTVLWLPGSRSQEYVGLYRDQQSWQRSSCSHVVEGLRALRILGSMQEDHCLYAEAGKQHQVDTAWRAAA